MKSPTLGLKIYSVAFAFFGALTHQLLAPGFGFTGFIIALYIDARANQAKSLLKLRHEFESQLLRAHGKPVTRRPEDLQAILHRFGITGLSLFSLTTSTSDGKPEQSLVEETKIARSGDDACEIIEGWIGSSIYFFESKADTHQRTDEKVEVYGGANIAAFHLTLTLSPLNPTKETARTTELHVYGQEVGRVVPIPRKRSA